MKLRIVAAVAMTSLLGPFAARAAGSGPEISRKAQAYQLYQQSQMLLMNHEEEAAAELLERAIERDPAPDLLLEGARVEALLGRLDQAAALVDRALEARPGWSEALVERGDVTLARVGSAEDARKYVPDALEAYRAAIEANPASVDATRAFAELSAQAGHLDEAIQSLESLAAQRSLPSSLSLLLARLYLRRDRAPDAQPLLEALVRRAPSGAEAVDLLAGLYEAQERYDEAIALYGPLIESAGENAGLYRKIGLLQLEAGRVGEAVAALEKADHLDPADPEILLLLVQAYDGADNLEAALAVCNRLLALKPDSLEARFQHARLLRRQGDPAARREFEDLILHAGDTKESGERAAALLTMAWAQVGLIALGEHDWPAAENAMEEAVHRAHDPRPDLLRLLARAHLEAGHPAEAEKVAVESSARFPDDLELRTFVGEVRLAEGDEVGARACFRQIIDAEGGTLESYLSVSDAYMRRKRYTDADAILKEALRRRGEDDRLLFARGAALERLGHADQAERVLGRAVELNPKNAMALNYLGYMLADSGRRLDDSIAYVNRALALEPDNPAYLDSLGWALFKLARYAPAEEKLRAALRYDGTDPAIREHLGDLLIATGRVEEAVREWQTALDNGHDEPDRVREKMEKAKARLKDTP
jgi:tetratricopeptide (TPR) repeat protein